LSLFHTCVGVFTIANPIGNLPIVLSFTGGERRPDQRFPGQLGINVVVGLLALMGYVIFSAGEYLSSRLGASALQVLTKVMG
jgi:small neutral amino acid transporter SnatA (MarC family)